MKIKDIAVTRSGDKGSHVNIGVIANDKDSYDLLVKGVTEERVAAYFSHPKVKRYLWPNLLAINLVLEGVLEGGGSRSLRVDAQGKTFGVAFLNFSVE